MKKIVICLLLTAFCLLLTIPVRADYVLPYPSYMPGNKIYRLTRVVDQLKQYWYWGNIGQIKYHMQLSDKYLVEAKTLMEYKQYLLASDALKRSDSHFSQLPVALKGAQQRGIDNTLYKQLIIDEATKHQEILNGLLEIVPKEFTWTPEKDDTTYLELEKMVKKSIVIRNNL